MGCGCITPASTIHIENDQYVHSIKITKVKKGSNRKIGERFFGEENYFKRPFSKKEFQLSKKNTNFDLKLNFHKNTFASASNILKKQTTSIEDLRESIMKKRKNVKFKDEPRISIKLQNLDKNEFNEKASFIVFQKQNLSPKKFLKKPKYMINKVKTQKQQALPFINSSNHSRDYHSKTIQPFLQNVANFNLTNDNLPGIHRAKTQQNEPYLASLKQSVLLGSGKNQQFLKKKSFNYQSHKLKNPKQQSYQLQSMMDRINIEKRRIELN